LPPPKTLAAAVALVAYLGGYLKRGKALPAGHELVARGYAILQYLCLGYLLGQPGGLAGSPVRRDDRRVADFGGPPRSTRCSAAANGRAEDAPTRAPVLADAGPTAALG
jgi:hypothetical protein